MQRKWREGGREMVCAREVGGREVMCAKEMDEGGWHVQGEGKEVGGVCERKWREGGREGGRWCVQGGRNLKAQVVLLS